MDNRMVTKSYDNSYSVAGVRQLYLNNGTPSTKTTITYNQSDSASQSTINHPYPYVTGGPWSYTRTVSKYGVLNGRTTFDAATYAIYSDYQASGAVGNSDVVPLIGSRTVNDVLAETNPSRPVVDLPVFFYELRELPELVWKEGIRLSKLHKHAAKANLILEYGWKPLLLDLASMLDFQTEFEKRNNELSKLYRQGGSRHKRQLGKGIKINPEVNQGAIGKGTGLDLVTQKVTETQKWCSVHWVPDEDTKASTPSMSARRAALFRAMLGLHVHPSLVWEALPWSWLMDWFGDVGSFLSARRNFLGFHIGACYTMQHTVWETRHSAITRVSAGPGANFSYTPPVYRKESKSRSTYTGPTILAGLPILTGRQIGILASLAILKR